METIKRQIDRICEFPAEGSLNAIKEAKSLKLERIKHGIKMMKDSGLFTVEEINDISDYARTKLHVNHEEALERQVNNLRDNWTF
jgi:archaellum component FlaC